MELRHIDHRDGGHILAITGIGHQTQDGQVVYFFLGDVQQIDGKIARTIRIPHDALAFGLDQRVAAQEASMLREYLHAYLEANGTHKRMPSRAMAWVPHKPWGSEPIG